MALSGFWPRIILVAIGLGMVIYKMGTYFEVRKRRDLKSRAAAHTWLCMFFITLAAAFVSQPLRDSLNQSVAAWTGLHNTSILFEELSVAFAAFHIALIGYSIVGSETGYERNRKRLGRILVLGLLFLALVYASNIYKGPQMTGDLPASLPELVFKAAIYVLSLILLLFPANFYLRYYKSEGNSLARLRLALWFSGTISAESLVAITLVWVVWGYIAPASPILIWIQQIIPVFMIGASLWFAGYLPASKLTKVSNLLAKMKYFKAYLKLLPTNRFLKVVVYMPEMRAVPSLWRVLTNPELQLYQTIIDILDRQKILFDEDHSPLKVKRNALRNQLKVISKQAAKIDNLLEIARAYSGLEVGLGAQGDFL